ncbi:uncharacterized protein LOC141629384 [Silene latifolia]|uniref:uncharacterized protein LOC141629384 n=1 Tax=Silene latifolia TaxID=37657 RepID=UPI003D776894
MKHAKIAGQCKYEYPKSYRAETTTNNAGHPEYQRRNTGEKVEIRKHNLNNRCVIPYNPYLLVLFDCHLNVKVCSTMHAVKYLYKYIYKGNDRISFSLAPGDEPPVVDEITQYQSGQWVSPCEAAWHIFGFDLFETHPVVMSLQVHLPNMQTICLRPTENLAAVLVDGKRARTPLTEFFRKTSFTDLQTVNGYKCATFQDAAIRHHLLEQEDTAELCTAEACTMQMPSALRRLFPTMLVFAQPKDPSHLWNTHYDALSDGYRYKFPGQPQKVKRLIARSVEQYLEAMGKTMETFGLEHLETSSNHEVQRTRDIIDALEAPIPEECRRCKALLNPAQKEAFDTIIDHVNASKPGAFFVDEPGGTGKTFLYNSLYAEVHLVGEIVLPTTTSGIAALNIPTGRTTHSRFRIPLDSDVSLACDVPRQGSLAALIRAASLIIWDEASMAKRQNVESLDLLLRDLWIVRAPSGSGQDPICDLSTITFPELSQGTFDPNIFTTRALLTPLNDDVNAINNVLIEKFPANPVYYKSHDSMIDDNCAIYPEEYYLKTMQCKGMAHMRTPVWNNYCLDLTGRFPRLPTTVSTPRKRTVPFEGGTQGKSVLGQKKTMSS